MCKVSLCFVWHNWLPGSFLSFCALKLIMRGVIMKCTRWCACQGSRTTYCLRETRIVIFGHARQIFKSKTLFYAGWCVRTTTAILRSMNMYNVNNMKCSLWCWYSWSIMLSLFPCLLACLCLFACLFLPCLPLAFLPALNCSFYFGAS